MNTKRILGLVIGATLVAAVILVSLGFKAAPEARGSNPEYTGFGDLRRYEQQLELADRGGQVIGSSYAGFGDLHRFEQQQAVRKAVDLANNSFYAGMGDLHSFEARRISNSSAGMGDLHRYEAQPGAQK